MAGFRRVFIVGFFHEEIDSMFSRAALFIVLLVVASLALAADDAQGIKVNAVVHSVTADKINVSHEMIPELGWPPMTMDLAVAPDVDVGAIPTETPVELELIKGNDGIYQVGAVRAAQ